ncbi:MAG: hypothetical protein KC431_24755 [Myxococcales bacterium]|nr:hypothetical protein [Myxococcales bacterium]MCA9700761.1 hypothetical protein [Myxococcales bacterium]
MSASIRAQAPRLFSRAVSLARTLLLGAVVSLGALPLAQEAAAAPATSPTSSPTKGSPTPAAQGRSGPGGTYKTSNTGYQPPDFVYGGNAISFMGPFQIGLTPKGYVPRGRLGLQYDRQLHRAHWLHVNAAALFDRGSWRDFKMDSCGLTETGTCQAGTVAGMDLAVGYTHKLFIEKKPWIVPTFRGGLAGGFWYYPRIGGTREQTRELTWTLGIQLAAGIRFFLLRELAIGIDVEFRPGLAVHRERESAAPDSSNLAGFVLPIQVLPLIVEYRF